MTSSPVPQPARPDPPMAPLTRVVLVRIAVGIATVTVLAIALLWWAGTRGLTGAELATARFDALRTGLSVGLALGGGFALYLAWRRQDSTEIGLRQKLEDQHAVVRAYELQERTTARTHELQERAAQASEADAAARRITDLYTKAVELLGSDQAPVRLGGLYALERLAQDNSDQQPTIASVLCAYLRMPFPSLPPLADDATDDERERHDDRTHAHDEQRQVRDTTLDIFRRHRGCGQADELYWKNITINLDRANLAGANFIGADLTHADLNGANLAGANLTESDLATAYLADADLVGASLTDANLVGANLTGANLTRADVNDADLTDADLTGANLTHAYLPDSDLTRANLNDADLTDANLTGTNLTNADLASAHLTDANLAGADLTGADLTDADLTGANLTGVDLTGVDLTNVVGYTEP